MIGKLRWVIHGDILGNAKVYPAGMFVDVQEDEALFSIAELTTGTLIRAGDRSLVTTLVDYDVDLYTREPNAFQCRGCARTFATEKEHITHEIETGHGAPDAVQLWRKQCKAELDKAAGCDDRNSRAVRKARGALIK
jgi:hypothetical protein